MKAETDLETNLKTDLRAAEYVVGTLSREERAEFARQLSTDVALRRAVHEWQNRLAPLSAILSEVTLPPALWGRIEHALGHTSDATAGRVVDLAAEAARLNRARNYWRYATCIISAIALGLAIFVLDHDVLREVEPPDSYVAMVNRGGDPPALIVRVDPAARSIFVRPVATDVPPGHSLELWYIAKGKTPKSLGLVGKVPWERTFPAGTQIEKADFTVTVEPQGGSTTGGPTGPTLYSGQLIRD